MLSRNEKKAMDYIFEKCIDKQSTLISPKVCPLAKPIGNKYCFQHILYRYTAPILDVPKFGQHLTCYSFFRKIIFLSPKEIIDSLAPKITIAEEDVDKIINNLMWSTLNLLLFFSEDNFSIKLS